MQTNTTTTGSGSVATDETDRLIASNKVEGTAVYNRQGERLGEVYNFMVDKRSGQVAYAVMSFGGFLGLGKRCHPLPWRVLTYDTGQGGYVVDLDKERLTGAPSFQEGESPDWDDPGYGKGIEAYYADRPDRPRNEAAIDAAVDDTFPASDPPSWSGGATGAGTPDHRGS
jgi:PRC-barrel domain